MKKFCLLTVSLLFFGCLAFSDGEQEEIDYLLFQPNSGNLFVNQAQAITQLDNMARYLLTRDLLPGQINVYGYSAYAVSDVDAEDISRQRALFVINELQRRGVPAGLFSAPLGHGSVYLWGSNSNEADMIPNRRVRVLIDDIVLTPVIVNTPEPVIETPPVVQETKKPASRFPWEILLLLLLIPIIFLLSKIKRKPKPEPKPEPVKKEPPAEEPKKKKEIIVNLEDDIRFRSYELHLQHCDQYTDVDGDWFKALPEVCARYEAMGYKTYMENGYWWARKTE